MLKKSCLVICLLASAASASQNANWDGEFKMEDGSTISRSSTGLSFEKKNMVRQNDQSTLSLLRTDAKNEDDTVELEAIFTPRTFLKTLEQTGEVVGIEPPSLVALLRQPAPATAQPVQTDMEKFAAVYLEALGRLPTAEEQTSFERLIEAAKRDDNRIMAIQYVTLNVTGEKQEFIPGKDGQADRLLVTRYVDEHISE